MRRARLTVAYDGSGFHGLAETTGPDGEPVRTVMGDLRTAIETVVRHPVEPIGAGRTDAGVHAWGQVVSLDLADDTDLEGLRRRLDRLCGPEIAVRDIRWADTPDFHARFSAHWRHYRYDVLEGPSPVPQLAWSTWHVRGPLDLWAMQLACDPLIGEHDFSSFCRRPKVAEGEPPVSLVRRVLMADWREVSSDFAGPGRRLLRFEIRATAFCHQMVRSIVGTLVEVGAGDIRAGDVRSILLRRDRQAAGRVAPPHGLTLWDVGY
ncbi:MAG: tRNA pseudouridine synthase [Actinomycetota bacterium]|jgi:tRNA pseudouridine38-40 synthase